MDEFRRQRDAGRWAVQLRYPTYWPDWDIMQVIMMTRIHAMYGRSKKMLIFLIVVLLASMIGSGVMTLVADIGVSGGTFLAVDISFARDSRENIRGRRLFRGLSVCNCLRWHIWRTSAWRGMDSYYRVGAPCFLSCSLDCRKTLVWIAPTWINGINHQRLLHGFNQKPYAILCGVSSVN